MQRMFSLLFSLHVMTQIFKEWCRFSLRGNNQLLHFTPRASQEMVLQKKPPTQTHTYVSIFQKLILQVFVKKIPAFGLHQGGKQSSYPGALCTKPRTTASIHRSGTHSTNRQHILCQMQSDLVRSVRQGTKTLRISSEVEEKIGK